MGPAVGWQNVTHNDKVNELVTEIPNLTYSFGHLFDFGLARSAVQQFVLHAVLYYATFPLNQNDPDALMTEASTQSPNGARSMSRSLVASQSEFSAFVLRTLPCLQTVRMFASYRPAVLVDWLHVHCIVTWYNISLRYLIADSKIMINWWQLTVDSSIMVNRRGARYGPLMIGCLQSVLRLTIDIRDWSILQGLFIWLTEVLARVASLIAHAMQQAIESRCQERAK